MAGVDPQVKVPNVSLKAFIFILSRLYRDSLLIWGILGTIQSK